MADNTDVARRLFDALEAGDLDTVRGSYHPDAQIWHNTDEVVKSREHTMEIVGWMLTNMPGVQYVDRHCSATDDGFVQRHVVVITRPDGTLVRLPCCVVATLRDGKVTHLYEYFDSAAQAQTGVAMSSD